MNRKILIFLCQLKINELVFIANNLRLGIEHLKKIVGDNQFNFLISCINLSDYPKDKLTISFEEKLGYTLRYFNVFLTSLLGFVFGLSGFLKSPDKILFHIFVVFIVAFFLGILLSILSHKHIKKISQNSISRQKIAILETFTIRIIIQKTAKKNHKSRKNLQKFIDSLSQKLGMNSISGKLNGKKLADFFIEMRQFYQKNNLENPHVDQNFREKHLQILRKIASILNFIETYDSGKNVKFSGEFNTAQNILYQFSSLHSLNTENPMSLLVWLSINWQDVLLASSAILAGSFASFFLFFYNIPKALYEHGYVMLWEKVLHSQYFWFTTAFLFAAYFAFSNAKFLYKKYLCEHLIKLTQNKSIALQMKYIYLEKENLFFDQLRVSLKQLNRLYNKDFYPKNSLLLPEESGPLLSVSVKNI